MEFLDPELDRYITRHTDEEPTLLNDLNRDTWLKELNPRMLAGHYQGRVLSMLSHMIKPKRVLEVGTYTGYSALCWAEGLAEDGHIHTIDVNEELEDRIVDYLDQAGIRERVTLHIGNAVDIIPTLDETWDLVFLDADKLNYPHYLNLVIDRIRTGGYLIADNVLWSGKVIEKVDEADLDTQGLLAFNEAVQNNPSLANVLLPIRDGLMVARKV